MLYNNPPSPAKDYGMPYDSTVLSDLENHLPTWDESAYLPDFTLQWCTTQLLEIGFNPYDAKVDLI